MATIVVTVGQREVQELPRTGKQKLLPTKGPENAREYGETLLALIKDGGESVLDELGAPMVEPSIKWVEAKEGRVDSVVLVCTDQAQTNPKMATTDTEPIAEILQSLLTRRFPTVVTQKLCLRNLNPANDEEVAPAIRHALESLGFSFREKCYVLPQGGTPSMKYQSIFALLDIGCDAVVLRAVPSPGEFHSRVEINQHVPELVNKRTVLGNMEGEVRRLCQAEDFAGASSVMEAYPGLIERNPSLALIARLGKFIQAWNFEGLRGLVQHDREVIANLNKQFYDWLRRLLGGNYVEAFQVSLAEIRNALDNGYAVLAMARYYNALELGCASRLEHLWAFGHLSRESIDRFLAEKLPAGISKASFVEMSCAAGAIVPNWRYSPSGDELGSTSVPRKAERVLACFGPNSTRNCPLALFNNRYRMFRALRTLMGRVGPGEACNPIKFRHEGPYAHDSTSISVDQLWEAFRDFAEKLRMSDSPSVQGLYAAVKDATEIYEWIRKAFEACELPVSFDPYRELRELSSKV